MDNNVKEAFNVTQPVALPSYNYKKAFIFMNMYIALNLVYNIGSKHLQIAPQ